jgi:hypothetical protein
VSKSVEYLFAPHIDLANAFAKERGWSSYGRAAWQKRDGCVVYFLSLLVQLEIVSAGETVHVVGKVPGEVLRAIKRLRAIAVCYGAKDAA